MDAERYNREYESDTRGALRPTYGGGRFVVAGYRFGTDDYHPWIYYSTDGGVTWTQSNTTANTSQAHGQPWALTYGGGRFVVAGYRLYGSGDTSNNYHPWIAYSTDGGVTWTPSETTSDENQEHGPLYALAYGDGRFVVAGYRYEISGDTSENYHPWLVYSTDGGETWTKNKTTVDESQAHGQLYALTYAPDSYCWKFEQEKRRRGRRRRIKN